METYNYYDNASLSAAFYDLVSTAYPPGDDEPFYAALIGKPGSTVLELGCGTGRITLGLARRGFEVVGVDLSAAMIYRAKLKLNGLHSDIVSRVRLLQDNMSSVNLGQEFDSVIVPFYSFSHLPDFESRASTMSVIARHLKAGGCAAIHVPLLKDMRRPLGKEVLAGSYNQAGDKIQIQVIQRKFDEQAGCFLQTFEYTMMDSLDRVVRRSREELTFYWFSDEEMIEHVKTAGLSVEIKNSMSGEDEEDAKLYILSKF